MKITPVFRTAAACLLVGAPTLSAQISLTFDDTAPFADRTYRQVQDFATAGASFNTFNGLAAKAGGPTYDVQPIGTKETVVTIGGNEVTVFDICAEMFVSPTGTSNYTVTSGFGDIAPSLQNDVQALLSNAFLNEFNLARNQFNAGTGSYDDVAVIGAAMQIAFWDLVEDDGNTATGDLVFASDLGLTDTLTTDARNKADQYLTNIGTGGIWENQLNSSVIEFYYADSDEQDRLWFRPLGGPRIVPEPSVALLGMLGGLLALRRRR